MIHERRECDVCKKYFVPKTYNQRYCSLECSKKAAYLRYGMSGRAREYRAGWMKKKRAEKKDLIEKQALLDRAEAAFPGLSVPDLIAELGKRKNRAIEDPEVRGLILLLAQRAGVF